MKKIVPPREEVEINGTWYRAGQEYEDGKPEPKPKKQKKEVEDGLLSD